MSVRDWGRHLLDVLYPPICLLCGGVSGGPYPHLCGACFSEFEPVDPGCPRCGQPFSRQEPAHECLACLIRQPPFDRVRSLFLYRGAAALAVRCFKYGRTGALDGIFWDLVSSAVAGMELPPVEVVVPVPEPAGAWKRRRKDAAWFLAAAAAEGLGTALEGRALRRVSGRRQVGLSQTDREANARRSYRAGGRIAAVQGRGVLLVDDVYTTGATVRACARILRKSGAGVSVLTLARRSAEHLSHLLVDLTV